jgi:hypothetical protein
MSWAYYTPNCGLPRLSMDNATALQEEEPGVSSLRRKRCSPSSPSCRLPETRGRVRFTTAFPCHPVAEGATTAGLERRC